MWFNIFNPLSWFNFSEPASQSKEDVPTDEEDLPEDFDLKIDEDFEETAE